MNIKKAVISLDLIFDYNNILFSSLRSFLEQRNLVLDSTVRKYIEQKNPQSAFQFVSQKVFAEHDIQFVQEWEPFFKQKMKFIKPQLGSISLLETLKSSQVQIEFISYLNDEFHKTIRNEIMYVNGIQNIFDRFQISIKDQKNYDFDGQQNTVFISGSLELLEQVNTDNLKVFVLNNNFKELKEKYKKYKLESNIHYFYLIEDIDFPNLTCNIEQIERHDYPYTVGLDNLNSNKELQYWGNTQKLDNEFRFQNEIVAGFGRGSRQLGMPTANIKITDSQQQLLNEYSTGIYYGEVKFIKNTKQLQFIDYDKLYHCVVSIGYNPYYDLKQKTFEVYIMDTFQDNFYGEVLQVDLQGFIRSEADFKEFNQLIQFIQNDISISKCIAKL